MDLDSFSVHKHAKIELGQYPAILTEQAWSITHYNKNTYSVSIRRRTVVWTLLEAGSERFNTGTLPVYTKLQEGTANNLHSKNLLQTIIGNAFF